LKNGLFHRIIAAKYTENELIVRRVAQKENQCLKPRKDNEVLQF